MPKIKIDDMEYNSEDLSENGVNLLRSLQFVENKLKHIAQELEVYKTAHVVYLNALKSEMEKFGIEPIDKKSSIKDEAAISGIET